MARIGFKIINANFSWQQVQVFRSIKRQTVLVLSDFAFLRAALFAQKIHQEILEVDGVYMFVKMIDL